MSASAKQAILEHVRHWNAMDKDAWLALFAETARETCPPAGAAHVIERAETIAQSLHIGIETARGSLRLR